MEDLDLTDSQKEQVKSIMDAFHKKQQQAHEEMLAEMKKVLKSDQYEKLEKRMRPPPRDGQERRGEERHGEGHHEKGGPPDRQ